MVWDGLIILSVVVLAAAGWNVGIINSWRGPFAVIIATLATQRFYVDFATWIVQQLRVQPEMAIGMGYVLLWLGFEIISEILLSVIIQIGSKNRPQMFERVAGAALGVVKMLVVVILPLMALQVPIKVPVPPPEKCPVQVPLPSGLQDSVILRGFRPLARSFIAPIGGFVVSTNAPTFKPNFMSGSSDALNPDLMELKGR